LVQVYYRIWELGGVGVKFLTVTHKEIELMKGIHKLQPVVIVDEAHLLDKEMLEEVRFLLNFKMV